jgi:hypothetical protein
MPFVGFEHTIPASERAKTVHALGRLSTLTGSFTFYFFQLQLHCLIAYRYLYFYPFNAAFLTMPTVAQTVKKFPAFCGTRRFIITFTRSGQCIPSWARWIQSTLIHCFLNFCVLHPVVCHVHLVFLHPSTQRFTRIIRIYIICYKSIFVYFYKKYYVDGCKNTQCTASLKLILIPHVILPSMPRSCNTKFRLIHSFISPLTASVTF